MNIGSGWICLAHQSELVAKSINNSELLKAALLDMRQFIVKCKGVAARKKLQDLELKAPESPVDVRFHSYYDAMLTLTENEDAFRGLAELDDPVYMRVATWAMMREYVEYDAPLYQLTMKLQKTELTIRKYL